MAEKISLPDLSLGRQACHFYNKHVRPQLSPLWEEQEQDGWLELVRLFSTDMGIHVLTIMEDTFMACGNGSVETVTHMNYWHQCKQALMAMKRLELFTLGCRASNSLLRWREQEHPDDAARWHAWLRADMERRDMNRSEKNVICNYRYCSWLTRYCRLLRQQFPDVDTQMVVQGGWVEQPLDDIYCDVALGEWAESINLQQTDRWEIEQRKAELDDYIEPDGLLPPFHQLHNKEWLEYIRADSVPWTGFAQATRNLLAYGQMSCQGGSERLMSHVCLMTAVSDYLTVISWPMVRYCGSFHTNIWMELGYDGMLSQALRYQHRMNLTVGCQMSILMHRLVQMTYNQLVVGLSMVALTESVNDEEERDHDYHARPMHPSVLGGLVGLETYQVSLRNQIPWVTYAEQQARHVLFSNLQQTNLHDPSWDCRVHVMPPNEGGQLYVFDLPMIQETAITHWDVIIYAWPMLVEVHSSDPNDQFEIMPWLRPLSTTAFMNHSMTYNIISGNRYTLVGDCCGLQRTQLMYMRPLVTNLADGVLWRIIVTLMNAYYHPGFYHPGNKSVDGIFERSYRDLAGGSRRMDVFLRSWTHWHSEHPLWLIWVQMALVLRRSVKEALKLFEPDWWWNCRFVQNNAYGSLLQHCLVTEIILQRQPPSAKHLYTKQLLECFHVMDRCQVRFQSTSRVAALLSEPKRLWELLKPIREHYFLIWHRDLQQSPTVTRQRTPHPTVALSYPM